MIERVKFAQVCGCIMSMFTVAAQAADLDAAIIAAAQARAESRTADVQPAIDRAKLALEAEHLPEGQAASVRANLDALATASVGERRMNEPLRKPTADESLARLPVARLALHAVNVGRLTNTAINIAPLTQAATGSSLVQIDTSQVAGNSPGLLLGFLRSSGLVRLNSAEEIKALKLNYEGMPLDELADKLISRSADFAAVGGAFPALGSLIGPTVGLMGITADAATSFVVNANLIARLSELYGLRLSDEELSIAFLPFVAGTQYITKYGLGSKTDAVIRLIGLKLAQGFRGDIKSLGRLYKRTLAKPAGATPLGLEAGTESRLSAAADRALAGEASAARSLGRLGAVGAVGVFAAQTAAHAATSYSFTKAFGYVAKVAFRSTFRDQLEWQNEGFRRFLMTSGGEGFLKLVIASIGTNDRSALPPAPASGSADGSLQMKMVRSLVRAARICSADDLALRSADKEAWPLPDNVAYACDRGATSERAARISAELASFSAIPQERVVALRAASRSDRMRMAETLLQMQLLDGDQDPKETSYFRDVVVKILGLDSVDDVAYFERLRSYIIDNGWLESDDSSITGFRIRPSSSTSPFNLRSGPAAMRGPNPSAVSH